MLLWFATGCDLTGGCTRLWGSPVQQSTKGKQVCQNGNWRNFVLIYICWVFGLKAHYRREAEHLPPSS